MNDKVLRKNLNPSTYRCGYWTESKSTDEKPYTFQVSNPADYSPADLASLGFDNTTTVLVYRPLNKTTLKGGFITDGCQLLWSSKNTAPLCSCTHLTDFALIQISSTVKQGKLTGIRPRGDLYDLKLLRHWYQTLGFHFNLGLVPFAFLFLTFVWKEKRRLGFRESLMKEFYVYLSKFKSTEIKRLARQKELAVVGKNEQESKEDMLAENGEEESDELTDDEDYKELLENEKEMRASIEEKIKKYSADIQAMKHDLIRSRKQTNKVQDDIDMQMHLNEKEIQKLRERRVLLKGKEELKKLRIKQVELEKQRRLKAKLEALAKNKGKGLLQPSLSPSKIPLKSAAVDDDEDAFGKKIKQTHLPGFEDGESKDAALDSKIDKDNAKNLGIDASTLEIEKEIERDLKELEEEENRLKAEQKLQEALPDTEKELILIIPKTAIKKKHPLVESKLEGYTDEA